MAVVTGAGTVLKGADIAQDQSFNSVAISPVSGNSNASGVKQTDASGNTLFGTDTAGKLTAAGLSTAGAISGATLTTTGKVTVGGDLQSTGGNTTLGPTTVSNITSSGTARVNSSLTVTGGIDVGSVNSNGDILAQGKLTVNKGTQVIGLLTASGGLSSPSNGISVVGGTTTDSLVASGNTSLQGSVSTGALTSASVKSNGTLSATGATTLAGLTASSSSITGNETVGGTLGVTGAASLSTATATGTVTAKNLVLTSGGAGSLTFADGTSQTTAASGSGGSATASRAILDMGAIYNTGLQGGSLYGIYKGVLNATSTGSYSPAAFYDRLVKQPYAYSITGYSVINQLNQAFTLYYYKNGASLGSVSIPATAGSYAGSHAKGTYNFAVGDTFRVVVQPNGAQISMQIDCIIEWT